MQDRVPLYPGRVKLTPVSGQSNVYDMELADSPTVAGTALNKLNLLKDITAENLIPDYSSETLGKAAVGDVVLLNMSGVATEFIVVQQGNPDPTVYDSSCNGTWLMRSDAGLAHRWHSSQVNNYGASEMHSYLNGTVLGAFDADIQSAIRQVKIPYVNSTGDAGTVATGGNGLSTKVFLLSGPELNFSADSYPYFHSGEGAALEYFANCAVTGSDDRRVAYQNTETERNWWTRSPTNYNATHAFCVSTVGGLSAVGCTAAYYVRPVIILPSTLYLHDGRVYTDYSDVQPVAPSDLVPDDAFAALTPKIGDTISTARTDLGDDWVLCNGDIFPEEGHTELEKVLGRYGVMSVGVADGYGAGVESTYDAYATGNMLQQDYDPYHTLFVNRSGDGILVQRLDGGTWKTIYKKEAADMYQWVALCRRGKICVIWNPSSDSSNSTAKILTAEYDAESDSVISVEENTVTMTGDEAKWQYLNGNLPVLFKDWCPNDNGFVLISTYSGKSYVWKINFEAKEISEKTVDSTNGYNHPWNMSYTYTGRYPYQYYVTRRNWFVLEDGTIVLLYFLYYTTNSSSSDTTPKSRVTIKLWMWQNRSFYNYCISPSRQVTLLDSGEKAYTAGLPNYDFTAELWYDNESKILYLIQAGLKGIYINTVNPKATTNTGNSANGPYLRIKTIADTELWPESGTLATQDMTTYGPIVQRFTNSNAIQKNYELPQITPSSGLWYRIRGDKLFALIPKDTGDYAYAPGDANRIALLKVIDRNTGGVLARETLESIDRNSNGFDTFLGNNLFPQETKQDGIYYFVQHGIDSINNINATNNGINFVVYGGLKNINKLAKLGPTLPSVSEDGLYRYIRRRYRE